MALAMSSIESRTLSRRLHFGRKKRSLTSNIHTDMPTFIIAEAGVNHNGELNLAKQLIDIAADAGADAVKFQTFRAEQVVSRHASKAEYQTRTTDGAES